MISTVRGSVNELKLIRHHHALIEWAARVPQRMIYDVLGPMRFLDREAGPLTVVGLGVGDPPYSILQPEVLTLNRTRSECD